MVVVGAVGVKKHGPRRPRTGDGVRLMTVCQPRRPTSFHAAGSSAIASAILMMSPKR